MLPGKQYEPEDYLRAAWARRWVILIPAVLIAAGTAIVASQLPNRYRSTTTILIVPPRVPADYVRPAVNTSTQDRLQMIGQQIMSRTRLEKIMQEFNLYERERKTMLMEDVIERMRTDIHIDVGRGGQNDSRAFELSFDSTSARTAMLVTEKLANLYIQESLTDRESLATSTNQFLETQLADARAQLIEHEKKLEVFRQKNDGQLPEQVESNLQMMRTLQTQLQGVLDATNRDHDRLLNLQRQIADAEAQQNAVAPSTAPTGNTAVDQLTAARAALRQLQTRLKPEHPDIQRLQRQIADLEKKAEADAPLSADAAPITPAERAARSRVNDMKAEAEQLQRRLDAARNDEARLRTALASYKDRIERAPALESELTELMRDYSTLQDSYTSLLKKSQESKVAANLETREIGEQFRTLDAPRLPEKPISPNRVRIDAIGIAGGLALGFALALLLEYKDTTLKTDTDVVVSLALPVLAVVPAMITAPERRRAARRRILTWCASGAMFAGVVAAAIWKFGVIDTWVR
jgi:polysaccharide chain length determinant protein (PEP-CTERM system associated)